MYHEKAILQKIAEKVTSETKIGIIDTETTGLSSENDVIIQFSGVIVDHQYNVLTEISSYINPLFPVSPLIEELTGITNEFLRTQPPERKQFPEIAEFINQCDFVLAYNSPFDERFTRKMYERNGSELTTPFLDVLKAVKATLPDEKGYKLKEVAERLEYSGDGYHNASYDVAATLYVVKNLDLFHIKEEDNSGTIVPLAIFSARYWEGYKGHSRVFISTEIGQFFYDTFRKRWGLSRSWGAYKEQPLLDTDINYEMLVKKVFEKFDCTEETFVATIKNLEV